MGPFYNQRLTGELVTSSVGGSKNKNDWELAFFLIVNFASV